MQEKKINSLRFREKRAKRRAAVLMGTCLFVLALKERERERKVEVMSER